MVSLGEFSEILPLEATVDVSVVGVGPGVILTVPATGGILLARPRTNLRLENLTIRTSATDGLVSEAANALCKAPGGIAAGRAAGAARLLLGRSLAQDTKAPAPAGQTTEDGSGGTDDEPLIATEMFCVTVRAGRCTVYNCRFERCAYGGVGVAGGDAELLACACAFDAPRGTAISARSGARARVEGCEFDAARRHGVEAAGGASCAIMSCAFRGTAGHGVALAGSGGARIERCTFVGGRRAAVAVSAGADPLVADDDVDGGGRAGFFIFAGGRGRFERNALRGCRLAAVEVQCARVRAPDARRCWVR